MYAIWMHLGRLNPGRSATLLIDSGRLVDRQTLNRSCGPMVSVLQNFPLLLLRTAGTKNSTPE
jgi:hypothetical protein